MILTDTAILTQIAQGNIVISPFEPKCLGSNSYDVHLSPKLKVYRAVCTVFDNKARLKDEIFVGQNQHTSDGRPYYVKAVPVQCSEPLDAKLDNPTIDLVIPPEGLVLKPGILYLGTTLEFTRTNNLVPYLEGKSSIGRLGIKVHVTAGKGDIGFHGHWTLEIEVTHPIRVYPGMAFAQISYFRPEGFCMRPYSNKVDAKYNNSTDEPLASRNNLNFSAQDSNAAFKQRFADSGIAGLPDDDE